MNPTLRRLLIAAVSASVLFLLPGCPSPDERSEAIDPTTLPQSVRADYDVFAQRCSKCHSLARPLNSGIDNDEYWKMYVERMRRQPASGISVADTVPILRFLHVFSIEERKKKGEQLDLPPPDAGALPDASPALDAGLPLAPRAQ
jgi:hypothetical protein